MITFFMNTNAIPFMLLNSPRDCEESTREEVGCVGNEDVKMDEWSHQAGQN